MLPLLWTKPVVQWLHGDIVMVVFSLYELLGETSAPCLGDAEEAGCLLLSS